MLIIVLREIEPQTNPSQRHSNSPNCFVVAFFDSELAKQPNTNPPILYRRNVCL